MNFSRQSINVWLTFLAFIFFVDTHAQIETQGMRSQVAILDSDGESFVQYLPSTFSPEKKWPVLFIFDPMGNGINGIAPFLKSSERFGYILIASNNARNGMYQENFDIASRLITQVLQSLPIDNSRLYIAGFSGGSRLASAIAVLTKRMEGVIAFGSGFSLNVSERPSFESFSYAGVVGNLDMNYSEMYQAHLWLSQFKVPNSLFVFEGGHQWPHEDEVYRVFSWLEMEAYRKGLKLLSFENQKALLTNDVRHADSLFKSGYEILAFKNYERIYNSFSQNLIESKTDSIYNFLKKDREIQAALKSEPSEFKDELEEIRKITSLFLKDFENPNASKIKRWRKKIEKLKDNFISGNTMKKARGIRVLRHISALAMENGVLNHQNNSSFERLIFSAELCLLIEPQNGQVVYQLVKAYITNANLKLGLDILEKAFKDGTLDPTKFINYPLHDYLKENERYRKLLEDYKVDFTD